MNEPQAAAGQDEKTGVMAPMNPPVIAGPRVTPSPLQPCPTCGTTNPVPGAATSPYVYAISRIEPRFPLPSVEKEFAQVTGRVETAGLTDRQAVQKVLSQRSNRYEKLASCDRQER